MVSRSDEMSSDSEKIVDDAMDRSEPLQLTG